jgi:hypothetical protein
LPTFRLWTIATVAILLSFVLEWRALPEQMDGFRDTQTAISAFWMKQEGIRFLHYPTPIFGPPWQAPMEFPLHQVLTALASPLFSSKIDITSRVVSLVCFEISAVLVVLIAVRLYRSMSVAVVALLFYLFNPFHMFYALYGLIDHLALALTLGYFYCTWRWLEVPSRYYSYLSGLACGILAALVKVTTLTVVALPLALIVLIRAVERWRGTTASESSRLVRFARDEAWVGVGIAALAVVPFVAVWSWTVHADVVKAVSAHTWFLTSDRLHNFIYGTWEWKTDPAAWKDMITRIQAVLVPGVICLLPLAGFLLSWQHGRRAGALASAFVFSYIGGIFLFFSLYRHDYYFVSITPIVALLVGVAGAEVVRLLGRNRVMLTMVTIPFLVPLLAAWPKVSSDYEWAGQDIIRAMARAAQYATPPDEWIVADQRGWGWSSVVLFQAERKGFIVDDGSLSKGADRRLAITLADPRFTTVTALKDDLAFTREHWSHAELVFEWRGAHVYKVTNDANRLTTRAVPVVQETTSSTLLEWRVLEPLAAHCIYRFQVRHAATGAPVRFTLTAAPQGESGTHVVLDYPLFPDADGSAHFAYSPSDTSTAVVAVTPEAGVTAFQIRTMNIEAIGCETTSPLTMKLEGWVLSAARWGLV